MKRYTEKQIRELIASGKDKTDWAAIDAVSEEEIEKLKEDAEKFSDEDKKKKEEASKKTESNESKRG